ncbi:hypothetical protein JJA65_003726 [Escherichia coli]|nr:hypothetical protein [Escherichia coli]EGZ0121564.1 hypothetical protein [Escherichia coli]
MCPECFFLMLCFCGYCSSSSSSFRSSPVYGFPGRPPGGAGCRERSQRSCLRPGGLPSLTQNPRLAATGTVAPPLSRRPCRAVACAPGIPAKRRRDVRSNAVSQTALHVVAAGPCSLPAGATHPYESLSPGA